MITFQNVQRKQSENDSQVLGEGGDCREDTPCLSHSFLSCVPVISILCIALVQYPYKGGSIICPFICFF